MNQFSKDLQNETIFTIQNNQTSEIIIYRAPKGKVSVDVIYNDETFWLTQKAMAQLFGCSTDNHSLHLKNIFKSGELDQISVTEEFLATASDGIKRNKKLNGRLLINEIWNEAPAIAL